MRGFMVAIDCCKEVETRCLK